jgi:DNA-directed RNA polymerase specialized sigma24 family protein
VYNLLILPKQTIKGNIMAQAKPPKKAVYLTNKELLAEVINAKTKGVMTDKLAGMLMMLTRKYAKKGNFVNYTYNEDMVSYALMMLVRTWNSFNPEKSNNPFAFYTQCIKNSFVQYLNQEKRQRNIRDMLLVDQGMNPSYGFGDGTSRAGGGVDDEEDFETTQRAAQEILKNMDNIPTTDQGEIINLADDSSGEPASGDPTEENTPI